MRRIVIFHFSAIELFPPALNLIRYLGNDSRVQLRIYTTLPPRGITRFIPVLKGRVDVIRLDENKATAPPWRRAITYAYFHIYSFLSSLVYRPEVIFYFETFSAVVPIFLKKWIFRNSRLFIHYHEYMNPSEYKRTVLLWKVHSLERKWLQRASWVSHTNEVRMRMFLNDIGLERSQISGRVIPNYPPKDWVGDYCKKEWNPGTELKLVYVGAVGFGSFYFAEIMEWVESMEGNCTLDVYSNQSTSEIASFASKRGFVRTRFMPPVAYYNLPRVLCNYDVGLILYKGDSDNVRFCEPNKLFEYLNVGLDVWFSKNLEGIYPHVQESVHPMVIPLDFETMSLHTTESIYQNKSSSFQPVAYRAESVYGPLKAAILDE